MSVKLTSYNLRTTYPDRNGSSSGMGSQSWAEVRATLEQISNALRLE